MRSTLRKIGFLVVTTFAAPLLPVFAGKNFYSIVTAQNVMPKCYLPVGP
jgi:hypothetical protein